MVDLAAMILSVPPPLSRYELFKTHDVDEARESVARIFCPHELSTTKPRSVLDARHHCVVLDKDVGLNYVQYGASVQIEPGFLRDFYLLQIPMRGGASVHCGKQHVLANCNVASLPSPSEPLRMKWEEDSPHLIIRFSVASVQRHLERMLQAGLNQPLVFDLSVELNRPESRPLFNFIQYLYSAIDQDSSFPGSALAAQAEDFLLTGLLTRARHNHSSGFEALTERTLLPKSVRRAQDYMHSHVSELLSLAYLCEEIGVGARSLQSAFRGTLNQSPMQYWRDIRLQHVRSELRSEYSENASITQIASRFGFFHYGNFAALYKERFGELPTHTVKGREKKRPKC